MPISYQSEFIDSWKAKAHAEDILKVFDSRKIRSTKDQREKVSSCTDLSLLDTWFDRALTATTIDEIFEA